MNKKEVLNEIELLIKSIKLHYDNLETEGRIPSIELELITSKIRKLHEKSIVYNYLHHLEEGHHAPTPSSLQAPLKRPKLTEDKHGIEKSVTQSAHTIPAVEEIQLTPQSELAQASIADPLKKNETEGSAPLPVSVPPPIDSVSPKNHLGSLDFSGMLGLNDRILFSRSLFGGDVDALTRFMKALESCKNWKDAEALISETSARYKWNKADEVLETLIGMIRSKLG